MKRIQREPIEEHERHICDECKFGRLVDEQWNRSYITGEILTLRCPHYKDGKYMFTRRQQACEKFKSK